ncbi:hypothetical protein ACFQRC_04670 [Enterovirga sp. GCM10030262]|uniref:hypothetical protein n=1 Tax=Enterovirga sp. GCM10030262 TaxID=3273391 RepID=UPI0036172D9E
MTDRNDKLHGEGGAGESGGGAYPNPHKGRKPSQGGYMGHGGQSDMAYHGHGRLGEDKVGENANAPAGETGDDEIEDNRGK